MSLLDQLDPTSQTALHAMAEAHDAKRWDDCVTVGAFWLEARGGMPAMACVWYAQSLMALGHYDEAVRWARAAVDRLPSSDLSERITLCAARATYAQALSRTGQFSRARRVLKEMTAVPIDHPETLEKQGHTLLAISDKWRAGWAMHEARAHNATLPDGLVRWDGTSAGRVGVLHEQGIGDAVLFARWLPEVARRSGQPVVWFGPEQVLGRWMADIPGVVVGDRGASVTPVDVACYAMSLPHLLGCERPSLVPPPLAPDSLRVRRRAHRPERGRLRVGVCWKGSATGWHDFERSFTADDFTAITAPADGVEFVNLCQDATVAEASPFAPVAFGDLYETGALIATLDLVVSVDTSIVHVAGSLGVPTLAIVPTVPDWRYRWPAGGDTGFYPSVTVLRRQRADDRSVLAKARTLVERYATRAA